ncbi:MAG: amidohydrolase family protein [Clostridiales bacterium]|nr:amidohydrolase family protein [Clostridiales bacterium]
MNGFDLLIKNGSVITMDGALSKKRWLAVKDGIIQALGDSDFTGEARETINLDGRALIPGLVDAHAHVCMTGVMGNGLPLAGVKTSKGILDIVEEACAKDGSDTLIVGGNMFMPNQMEDGRVPDIRELDRVSGNHPVMLVFWTVHGGVANTKALELASLPEEWGYIKQDGMFLEDKISFYIISSILGTLSDSYFEEMYTGIAKNCASLGMTTVHALEGMFVKDDKDVEILLRIRDELPIEFVPYWQTFDLEKVKEHGLKQIGGCLSLDGSPPQITGCFFDAYPCAPYTRGLLNFSDRHLYEFVTACTKADMQVAVHAIGERAIDQITWIYRQVDKELGIKHLRDRIEHFALPGDEHIKMAAEMNLIAATQPATGDMLDNVNGNLNEAWMSKEKAQIVEKFSRYMDGGVMVIGGSDSPVTLMDALFGIDRAVNAFNPARRVSLDDALKLYTINAAWAAHQEDTKGSLEVGKHADMVILNKDPYTMEGGFTREAISVDATYKKGVLVYSK